MIYWAGLLTPLIPGLQPGDISVDYFDEEQLWFNLGSSSLYIQWNAHTIQSARVYYMPNLIPVVRVDVDIHPLIPSDWDISGIEVAWQGLVGDYDLPNRLYDHVADLEKKNTRELGQIDLTRIINQHTNLEEQK